MNTNSPCPTVSKIQSLVRHPRSLIPVTTLRDSTRQQVSPLWRPPSVTVQITGVDVDIQVRKKKLASVDQPAYVVELKASVRLIDVCKVGAQLTRDIRDIFGAVTPDSWHSELAAAKNAKDDPDRLHWTWHLLIEVDSPWSQGVA